MVLISENVSRKSMNFANQRKAYMLRHSEKLSWRKIAKRVFNLQGLHPTWVTVKNVVTGFSVAKGCRKFHYSKCGRKPWKLTADVQQFILRRLLSDRVSKVVTSVTLQADLAAEMQVDIEGSTLRKFLLRKGYRWLPRNQKRKYSKEERDARVEFAKGVVRLSKAELRKKLCMSLDGVVLSSPPANDIERFNYCWSGVTHMWRKKSEANLPRLAGGRAYDKQVPISRAVPFWGGLSEGGFAPVLWHLDRKKTNKEQWAKAVQDGKLTEALKALNPKNKKGPWTVLCDGESFLRAKVCMPAYRSRQVRLWDVPSKSPDLNPVEMFWGWLRKKLRQMDLADLRSKRRPLGKTAYVARIKGVIRTRKAQVVAKNFAKRFRKACEQVIARKGAAADN